MIILDKEDQQQEKSRLFVAGPTLRFPERVATRSLSPLPDYETSEAQHHDTVNKALLRKRGDSRFWRITFVVLAIYVALSLVIGVPLIVSKVNQHSHWPSDDGPSFLWAGGNSAYVKPTNVAVLSSAPATRCDSWDRVHNRSSPDTRFNASGSYTVTPSGSFFIRSNLSPDGEGTQGIAGRMTTAINPDSTAKDAVLYVELLASSNEVGRLVSLCFSDAVDSRGLSIRLPLNITSPDHLLFTVRLLFPRTSYPSKLENFATSLPMFSQYFNDLRQHVTFDKVDIYGAKGDITFTALQAPRIAIHNTLGSITGAFNATESLTLDTIEGPIFSNITLVHMPDSRVPTALTINTGNKEINARVTLLAPSIKPSLRRANSLPIFVAHVSTFNAPLNIDVSHSTSTPSVPLQLLVQNNLAKTTVSVDAKYQGFFNVQTKLASAVVQEGTQQLSADPSGKSRKRTFVYAQNTGGRISGWVGWGKKPPAQNPTNQGRIDIFSSLSSILLRLGPP